MHLREDAAREALRERLARPLGYEGEEGLAQLASGILSIAAVKMSGAIDLDWNAIEASITHSLAWLQGKADGFKEVLTGYLPSAGAGGAGTYFGFRKK